MTYNDSFTKSATLSILEDNSDTVDVMIILSATIAGVGIIANLNVVLVLSNHKKLRRKIPNIFIINQVSKEITIQVYE